MRLNLSNPFAVRTARFFFFCCCLVLVQRLVSVEGVVLVAADGVVLF